MVGPRFARLRRMKRFLAASVLLSAGTAEAHLQLSYPPARTTSQKQGPCGLTGLARGPAMTLAPGATITVTWDETINHPGHYRISFDADGDDDFVVPATAEELYSDDSVLEDGIADANGGSYSQVITLPDIECSTCTLQVIQLMTDKAPYGDGNDLYYQCADLVLAAGGDPGGDGNGGDVDDDPPADNPPGPAVGGCGVSSPSGIGMVVALLLGCLVARRTTSRCRRQASSCPCRGSRCSRWAAPSRHSRRPWSS